MKFNRIAITALGILSLSVVAMAQTFTGTTIGKPTFNRPLSGTPPAALSGVGTAVQYDVLAFTVNVSGSYVFQNTALGTPVWDNYTFLYSPTFSAAAPLTNVLIGNDDNTTIGLSGFTFSLTAGTSYKFVTTGFANTDFGDYSLTVRGPGTATLDGVVPEPASMLALGIGAAALLRRRRSSK